MQRFVIRGSDPHVMPQIREVEGSGVIFDLSHVDFIDPELAVTLASRIALFRNFEIAVTVVAPDSGDVATYGARLKMPESFEGLGCEVQGFPRVGGSHIPERILELREFRNSDDLEALAEQAGLHVSDEAAIDGLRNCLLEAGQNVYQHSRTNQGFVAAQFYPKLARYRFAIADAGIGYRASLAAAHSPSDDAEAIDLAMTKGVSGTGSDTRGLGLCEVRQIVTSHGGWVSVSSGTVTKIFKDPEDAPSNYRVGGYVAGTILAGSIRSRYGIHGR